MANSKLEHTEYNLPKDILDHLKSTIYFYHSFKDRNGYKRSSELVKTGKISYKSLERIKHEFTHDLIDKDGKQTIEYLLNGGDEMKMWVNKTLDFLRNGVETSKVAKTNAGGQYRDENNKVTNILPSVPKLDGGETKKGLSFNPLLLENYKMGGGIAI